MVSSLSNPSLFIKNPMKYMISLLQDAVSWYMRSRTGMEKTM
ncbi:MAG: hypothetical protein ACOCYF_01700 [Bacteroidota bacterium]